MRPLSLLETRVLAVLIEKQHTVPDSYPLSLNSLTLGCNQKSARDPVIDVSEEDIQLSVDSLRQLGFVMEGPASRVTRYQHNTERVLHIPAQSVALLAALMLRGPQTSAELRISCERLHKFADISAVEGFLDELATRADAALVIKLPRAPGAREARWAHLLSGMVESVVPKLTNATPDIPANAIAASELAVLKHEINELKAETTRLASELSAIKSALGI